MKKFIATAAIVLAGFSVTAQAQQADLDALLKKVQDGTLNEEAAHKQREAEFRANQAQQQNLLNAERRTTAQLERESARLEEQRRVNEQEITNQLEIQRNRLGQLQELFGVLQQAAGDARAVISGSHVTIDNPNRMDPINVLVAKAADDAQLPTIEDIEAWPAQMLLEMIGSGQIKTFQHEVGRNDGNKEVIDLTRIGDFGLVGNGRYYTLTNNGDVQELARQPSGRFTGTVDGFQSASSGDIVGLGLDPTRGQLLNIEVEKATLEDHLANGGPIGYITLGLGAIGVLLAVIQWLYLFVVGGKVRSQIRKDEANTNNPLGRVLAVYESNKNVDVETLELKLDEAILKETPALERFLTVVKLISAVAPLFGLLGTVTGMIQTFQAITLFGAGDPQAMAGGISAALITTVEGLVVAIPTLLLHSFVSGSSKSIIHVLEEQSAGIIAVHAEKEGANA
ncbi:MotA/TolQ/ExbB proton channel family protein [Kordiimonas sp. SCSIO 12610]|uniref:MotA/TolQ/ExbB proton channel family protein n=1 Tax=Kordiimonas sp. SCSIO 12610 TaxID=2829597 RepID=UPI00210EC562|nr:MotA/TolQ/ExbB proton channel family protein [Kordiimonas sp. SCSIO 12610]UTW55895.1 MotA/TolQ/ExbB proton channel family protein [Kordiimonas sp. SCSIO 12610]